MLKKNIIILLLLIIFTKPPLCRALEEFKPSEIIKINDDNWIETEHTQASVLFENGLYKQWYTSRKGNLNIAYSESNNGVNWINLSLLNFSSNTHDVYDPAILKINNIYYLYFAEANGSLAKIVRIQSSIGADFGTSNVETVLIPDQAWETNDVNSPAMYYENGKYFMFYTGHNSKWDMGLSISSDGLTFAKCVNNPILINDTVPKSILKLSNTYYLFFHSPNGIEYMEADQLGCDSVWKNRTVVFPRGFFPYVFQNGNELWMYYSTLENGQWKMNLATSKLQVQTTGRDPVIMIPGLFASWNKDAVLHGQTVGQDQWQLNPIVKEYGGFSKTLHNLGYQDNADYFVFPYDWRQPLEKSADDLNAYIAGLNLADTPDIVGHSLGGLVGRIYAQKYGASKIDRLVTVGSPHQGTALAYPAVEAGDTDTRDPKMWLAEKIILLLYKNRLQTDREVINERFSVLQDLLPTYNYLKQGGNDIPISQMAVKNHMLPLYNESFGTLYGQLNTVVGAYGSTLLGYTVTERSVLDSLLDIFPDGRPKDNTYYPGDGTVITFSAGAGNSIATLNKSHGQLIYAKEGIDSVLQGLNIPHDLSQITEGGGTTIFPSLLFLILSPAKLEVASNGHSFSDQEGIILIENPENGSYEIKAKGLQKGKYTILVGQLAEGKDKWSRIEGEITADPPDSQTDTYNVLIDKLAESGRVLTREQMFASLTRQVNAMMTSKNRKILKAISFFQKMNESYGKKNTRQMQVFLRQTNESLIQAYKTVSDEEKQQILDFIDRTELFYSYYDPVQSLEAITAGSRQLDRQMANIKALKENRYLLWVLEEKHKSIKDLLFDQDYSFAEILEHDAKALLQIL